MDGIHLHTTVEQEDRCSKHDCSDFCKIREERFMGQHDRFAHAQICDTKNNQNRTGHYSAERPPSVLRIFEDFMPLKAIKLVIQ